MHIDCVNIAGRSSTRVYNQITVGKSGDFQPLHENISQMVSNMAMVTINYH